MHDDDFTAIDVARAFVEAGLSVVPLRPDGSKKPAVRWKKYQTEIADDNQLEKWFTSKYTRIAIIAGAVSGGLEVLDFDQVGLFPEFKDIVDEHMPGLMDTLPVVQTPSGGVHVYYRCEEISGNEKLADYIAEDGAASVAIETRGEGGYVVAPPCEGYVMRSGRITTGVPDITLSTRSLLFAVARSLGGYTAQDFAEASTSEDSGRPGDEFNERGWEDCRQELQAAGWKHIRTRPGGAEEWKRPGKDDEGISATYGHVEDRFYVFSTNAYPFNAGLYTPFGVYATLCTGGDYGEAARMLAQKGYGKASVASMRLAVSARKAAGAEGAAGAEDVDTKPYYTHDNVLYYITSKSERVVADFTAKIEEVRYGEHGDDEYHIKGETVHSRKFACDISSQQFEDTRMCKIVVGAAAGPNAAVWPGMGGHLAPAIKRLSDRNIPSVRLYRRTGWSSDGFLMPGMEPDGVRINDLHMPYALDKKADLGEALVGLKGLIESHGADVGTVILSHMLAPPLVKRAGVNVRCALHLTGLSGSLKTTIAQAAMTIWGAGFAEQGKIIKWGHGTTPNALIALAAEASDLPFFIDNYKPTTGRGSKDFIGFIHNAVEGGEKWRSAQSGLLRSDHRELHCWPFSTGEDVIDSDAASIARMLILDMEWRSGEPNENLRQAQRRAADMSAIGREWIRFLDTDFGKEIQTLFRERIEINAAHWAERLQAIRPNMVNALRIAMNMAVNSLAFEAIAACPAFESVVEPFKEAHAKGLDTMVVRMSGSSDDSREAARFVEGLREALSTGRAVLIRIGEKDLMDEGRTEEVPISDRDRMIGWEDDEFVYVLVRSARSIVNRLIDDPILITTNTLGKQLEHIGLLAKTGQDRPTLVKRVNGVVRRVLWFDRSKLYEEDEGVEV